MRCVVQRKQFREDCKRQKRRGKNIDELVAAVELLAEQGALPPGYRPHRPAGEWRSAWECHIEPDWLLIYTIDAHEVLLIRTGTHADLFA
jgi:mRNA interferase YafQ